MSRPTKTHYVTLRLIFDEPMTTADALKVVGYALPKEARGVHRVVGPPPEKVVTQRLVRFKVARMLSSKAP